MKLSTIAKFTLAMLLLGATSMVYAEVFNVPGVEKLGRFHSMFSLEERFFLWRILIAAVMGILIGYSHDFRHRGMVGVKTYGSVCLGSAAFAAVSTHIYLVTGVGNALQNIGSITAGIGFLCAAVIFKEGVTVRGLSTAATIWTTAAVGSACGAGLFGAAGVIAVIVICFHLAPSRRPADVE